MSEPTQIQAERGEDYDILLPDGKSLFISVLGEAVVVLAYNADGSARGESLHLRLDDEDEAENEDTSDPDSTAPDRWTCWDASGVRWTYTDVTAEEAAYEYVANGDYVHPLLGEWTSFIEVQVAESWDYNARGVTVHVPLYPGSPPCWDGLDAIDPDYVPDDDGHKWSRVSSHGDGAGTFITERCDWCGILKDTRTRPQCPDCGVTLDTEAIRYRREEE
jgi:hypothetical protein